MKLWFVFSQFSTNLTINLSSKRPPDFKFHNMCLIKRHFVFSVNIIYFVCVRACAYLCVCVCGQAKWGNRTASWPLKWWRTWWRTRSLTSMSWSSGTRVSWRTVPPAGSTWMSSSSSMSRLDSTDSLSADGLHTYCQLQHSHSFVCDRNTHAQTGHRVCGSE